MLTPKKSDLDIDLKKECSFIPMEKLKLGTLVLDETRPLFEVYAGYTFFEDGDILLAKVTPCFENKNMAIARNLHNGIGFGSSEIYVLRCFENQVNDFLYFRLQESAFMELATGAMTGAGGLKRVPSDFLSNFTLAIPSIEEQIRIVSYIKSSNQRFDQIIDKAYNQIDLLKERRTALISAAVTGKIDVRHWQPEPKA